MELGDAPRSDNVEDRRGMKKAGLAIGGGAGILVAILGLVFGLDTKKLTGPGDGGQQGAPPADGYQEFAEKRFSA